MVCECVSVSGAKINILILKHSINHNHNQYLSMIYSLFLFSFVLFGGYISSYPADSACDYQGWESPSSLLPQRANQQRLKKSKGFEPYYYSGKKECQKFLKTYNPEYPTPCKGIGQLFRMTGILLWPFGPKTCTTYTDCWIGVLACGEPNENSLKNMGYDLITKSLSSWNQGARVPQMLGWSIRSLVLYIRVVGNEIVVPEQRYTSVLEMNGQGNDVLLAQYVLTKPGSYQIEMRVFELYPSVLYNWTYFQRTNLSMDTVANEFLGGMHRTVNLKT